MNKLTMRGGMMSNYDIHLHREGILNPKKPGYGVVCFVLEGEALLTLNQHTSVFTVGTIFYLRDNDYYLPIINKGLVATLHISYHMMELLSDDHWYMYRIPNDSKDNQHNKYTQQIKSLFVKALLADLTNIKIRRSMYVVEIYKILYERFKTDTNHIGYKEEGTSARIKSIKAYIDNHYQENISLNVVADHFYISPEHLSREFSKQIGITFTQYLKEKRLHETTYSLLFTNLSMEYIAYTHGFSTYNNFNRQFKNQFQLTPKQYRLKYKQENSNKKINVLTEEEKSIIVSKLQKIMENKALVDRYNHISLNDSTAIKREAEHKTYIQIGDIKDSYTPFLEKVLDTIETIPKNPVIVVHCSMKLFSEHDTAALYRQHLAFCLSMFSSTRIVPAIKIYDFDINHPTFKNNWSSFIDVIQGYFENKNGELFFDTDINHVHLIKQQIKEAKNKIPDIQIMINAPDPLKYDYEELNLNIDNCDGVDNFALHYSFNDLYDLNEMNNFDLDKQTHKYTTKLIKNVTYLNRFNKGIVPMEWNILNGDTPTSRGHYFNAALILKHICEITTFVSGIGYWLLDEASIKQSKISNPLSLYLRIYCKNPINNLLYMLAYFNGHSFLESSNCLKLQLNNRIFILLFNNDLYHPYDTNYQNNMRVIFSFKDIPYEHFRVTKITFDEDNGNIFKAIRNLSDGYDQLDYLNTKLIERYCSPNIEMSDYNSNNISETYYLKTNAVKLLIIQNKN